jgi:hypothetical protein
VALDQVEHTDTFGENLGVIVIYRSLQWLLLGRTARQRCQSLRLRATRRPASQA